MRPGCTFPNCDCVGDCWLAPPVALSAAVGSPCPYCSEIMTCAPLMAPTSVTRDHVLARSRGGSFADPRNRLIVCRRCNGDKADMTLDEFAAWLQLHGDPRHERVSALLALVVTEPAE